MNNATDEATKTALKAAITEEQLKAAAATDYEKNTGYVFDTKYYSSATVTTVLGTDLSWTAGGGSGSNQNVSEASPSCGYGTYTGSDASTELLSTTYYKEIGDTTYYVDTTVVDDAEKLVAALANAGVEAKKVDSDNTVYADSSDVVKTYEEVKALLLAEVTGYQNTPVEKFEAKDGYTYWVEIKTKEDDTTKVLDLAGVLRIGSTKNKAEDATNAFQLDTSLDNRVYDSGAYVTVEDEWTFAPDSRSVVKFSDDAEDVVLYFGENEAAWFEFDARGQSALNLEFTFDFNKEIADLFPEANIDFLTFTSKPATNRTGDLYIVADEDTYLYEVTDDGVKTVAYLPAGGTGSAAVSAALGVKNINGAEYERRKAHGTSAPESWVLMQFPIPSWILPAPWMAMSPLPRAATPAITTVPSRFRTPADKLIEWMEIRGKKSCRTGKGPSQ